MFKLIKLIFGVVIIAAVVWAVKYRDIIFQGGDSEEENKTPLKERIEDNLKEVADSVGHKALEKGKEVIKKKVTAKISLN